MKTNKLKIYNYDINIIRKLSDFYNNNLYLHIKNKLQKKPAKKQNITALIPYKILNNNKTNWYYKTFIIITKQN